MAGRARSHRHGNHSNAAKDNNGVDLSLLQTPMELSITGALQVARCLSRGTVEMQELLTEECDIIFECRVCRNLFRNLPNFIAHKRHYCQQCYADTKIRFVDPKPERETLLIQPEAPRPRAAKSNKSSGVNGNQAAQSSNATTTSAKSKHQVCVDDNKQSNGSQEDAASATSMSGFVQEIVTEGQSEAYKFYTNVKEKSDARVESMKRCLVELEDVQGNRNAKKQRVVPDAEEKDVRAASRRHSLSHADISIITQSFEQQEANPVAGGTRRTSLRQRGGAGEVQTPIAEKLAKRKDCDVKTQTCLKCKSTYSSLKTLHFHMMSLHSEKRTYYPCVFAKCNSTFTQIPIAVKHLLKTHGCHKNKIEKLKEHLKKYAYTRPVDDISVENTESEEVEIDIVSHRVRKRKEAEEKREKVEKVKREATETVNNITKRLSEIKKPKDMLINFESGFTLFKCQNCSKAFAKEDSLQRHKAFCFGLGALHLESINPPPRPKAAQKTSRKNPRPTASVATAAVALKKEEEKPAAKEEKSKGESETKSGAESVKDSHTDLLKVEPEQEKEEKIENDAPSEELTVPEEGRDERIEEINHKDETENDQISECKDEQNEKINHKDNTENDQICERNDEQNEEINHKDEAENDQSSERNDEENQEANGQNDEDFYQEDEEDVEENRDEAQNLDEEEIHQIEEEKYQSLDRKDDTLNESDSNMSLSGSGMLRPANGPVRRNIFDIDFSSNGLSNSDVTDVSETEDFFGTKSVSPSKPPVVKGEVDTHQLQTNRWLSDLTEKELEKIKKLINEEELRCLKCDRKYGNISNLHRHAFRHLGWKRFRCTLCDFTGYNRSECKTHLTRVHLDKSDCSPNKFILDLEPEQMKAGISKRSRVESKRQSSLRVLQKMQEVRRGRQGLLSATSKRPTAETTFNISTRASPRKFDISPYKRVEQSTSLLFTRSGHYPKPAQPLPQSDDDSCSLVEEEEEEEEEESTTSEREQHIAEDHEKQCALDQTADSFPHTNNNDSGQIDEAEMHEVEEEEVESEPVIEESLVTAEATVMSEETAVIEQSIHEQLAVDANFVPGQVIYVYVDNNGAVIQNNEDVPQQDIPVAVAAETLIVPGDGDVALNQSESDIAQVQAEPANSAVSTTGGDRPAAFSASDISGRQATISTGQSDPLTTSSETVGEQLIIIAESTTGVVGGETTVATPGGKESSDIHQHISEQEQECVSSSDYQVRCTDEEQGANNTHIMMDAVSTHCGIAENSERATGEREASTSGNADWEEEGAATTTSISNEAETDG